MSWAAPLWLFGLLPWSALVLYLLWGRRRRTDVPFLDLWQGGAEGVRVRRRVSPPPVALALALLSILLAILAAGRPAVGGPWAGGTLSVIVDRGYTMSAGGENGTRTADVVLLARDAVGSGATFQRMERWVVPGQDGRRTDASDLTNDPALTPTALDTRDAVRVAARAALARNPGPVVVLSDHDPGLRNERVIRIPPARPSQTARIVAVAPRETPAVQVMVRARGGPGIAKGTVTVSSGGTSAERRDVELLPDRDTDVFVDLPALGDFVKAELLVDGGDDQPGDDTAWVVREASWPRLEARAPLPPHVQRMVEVYARSRPPTDASKRVILVRDAAALPAGEPGVVLAEPRGPTGGTTRTPPEPVVRNHPVTRGVTWTDVVAPASASADPPAGWEPLVTSGGKVWVALTEKPIRAVWIGFETSEWARSPELVVFWANVFNWVGAGGERFASYRVGTALEGDWQAVELAGAVARPEPGLWPGLYRRASDGALRALHAPDVPVPPGGGPADWRERLDRVRESSGGRLELGPPVSLLALVCVALAALAWRRRNLTGFSVPRSF